VLPPEAELESTFRPKLMGGVQVIEGDALIAPPAPAWAREPYQVVGRDNQRPKASGRPLHITAVPYFTWANREPGAMQVWLRER
jgi:hypothetical protein